MKSRRNIRRACQRSRIKAAIASRCAEHFLLSNAEVKNADIKAPVTPEA